MGRAIARNANWRLLCLACTATMIQTKVGISQVTHSWIGGAFNPSGNWSTSADWNPAGVPANGDSAVISLGSGLVTYDASAPAVTLNSLYMTASGGLSHLLISTNTLTADSETLDFTNGGTSELDQNGGTNTIAGASGFLLVGSTYNLSGGTNSITGSSAYLEVDYGAYNLSNTGTLAATHEYIGRNADGSFNQTGGTNTSTTLALGLPGPYGWDGFYTQNGGTDTTTTLIVSGYSATTYTLNSGTLSATNEYIFYGGSISQTGGTQTVGTNSIATFEVQGGGYSVSGGTLNVNPIESFTAGSFSQSGGVNNAIGGIIFTGGYYDVSGGKTVSNGTTIGASSGAGTLEVDAGAFTDNDGISVLSTGQLILAGGTISTPTLDLGGQPSRLQWTGGTLNISAGGFAIGIAGDTGDLDIKANMALDVSGTLTVQSGYYLSLAGGGQLTVGGLSLGPSDALDVANSHFFVHYGSNSDPITTIRGYIVSGYAGGKWNGPGIISSVVAANPGYGLGYADSADPGNPANLASGTIEVMYTLLGDANLSGVVDGTDFGIVAANFNKGVTGWDEGDFNYDNVVDGTDFGDLAANFNKGASGTAVGGTALTDPALVAFAQANGLMGDVPEPVPSAFLLLASIFAFTRRRRRFSSVLILSS